MAEGYPAVVAVGIFAPGRGGCFGSAFLEMRGGGVGLHWPAQANRHGMVAEGRALMAITPGISAYENIDSTSASL